MKTNLNNLLKIIFFCFIFTLSVNIKAATYTVCSSGCDQTSVASAFAAYNLEPGDIIEIRADTVGGTTTVSAMGAWGSDDEGAAGQPVTLRARAGDKIIVDGTNSNSYGIFTNAKSYLNIENLEFKNFTNANIYIHNGSSNITIKDCVSSGIGRAIRNNIASNNISVLNFTSNYTISPQIGTGIIDFSGGGDGLSLENITIKQNTTDATSSAIYIANYSNVVLNNVEVTNSPDHGIQILGVPSSGNLTLNNVYSGVTRDGVAGGGKFFGIYITTRNADTVTLSNVNSSYNNSYGISISPLGGFNINNLNITDSSAEHNSSYGLVATAIFGTTTINNFRANYNGIGVRLDNVDNFTYTNGTSNYNTVDGFNTDSGSIGLVTKSISNYNGTIGCPTCGDGFSSHSTDNVEYRYNVAFNNKNTAFGHISSSTGKISNNVAWANGVYSDTTLYRCQMYLYSTANPGWTVKNNIIGMGETGSDYCEYKTPLSSNNVLDYNIYKPVNSTYFLNHNDDDFISWDTYHVVENNEPNSSISDDLKFNFSTSTDFSLNYLSPAIDSGTDLGINTTDFIGNPIYGNPDVGAYEYQPPYVLGSDMLYQDASIRVYGNGKYRYTDQINGAQSIDLSVAPSHGYALNNYSQYMDISVQSWSGTDSKQWVASSSVATTTIYTVGNLTPNAQYAVKVDQIATSTISGDSCVNNICTSNNSGRIMFTYNGGYSTHVFNVDKVTLPSAVTTSPSVIFGSGPVYSSVFKKESVAMGAGTSQYKFLHNLSYKMVNKDVKSLQQFLNTNGYVVSNTGPGSKTKETNMFGPATRSALVKFQKDKGIPATGFFGPITRGFINNIYQ